MHLPVDDLNQDSFDIDLTAEDSMEDALNQ
jgi:hypothetical protein